MVDIVITRGNTGQGLTITLTPQLLGYGWPVEAGVSVGMSNVTSDGVWITETYVYAALIPTE
ncbi:MAG: hypothetical protein AB7E80_04055 [Hyphomicrobiaceae bacterium]